MSVGPWQIAIIALVVFFLFGASRLGDIGKGLGEGIRNFKKGIAEDPTDADRAPKKAASSSEQLKQVEASEDSKSKEATTKKDA